VNAAASPAVLLAAARCSQRGLCRQGHGRRDSTLADKRLPQLPRIAIHGACTGRRVAGPFPTWPSTAPLPQPAIGAPVSPAAVSASASAAASGLQEWTRWFPRPPRRPWASLLPR